MMLSLKQTPTVSADPWAGPPSCGARSWRDLPRGGAAATAVAMLMVVAAPARANCPEYQDLATGIHFTVEGGESETFTRFGNDVLASVYRYPDGFESRALLARGLYMTEIVDLEGGVPQMDTRTVYSFAVSIPDMPAAPAGESWTVDVLVNDQGDFSQEEQSYSFGEMTRVSFGECSYRMVPVEVRYSTEPGYVEFVAYLPDLGLSYLAGLADSDGTETYAYLTIEALP